MSTRRKRTENSGGNSRTTSSKTRAESTHRDKRETKPAESEVRPNPKLHDLPPNENIQKRADEVYGDTEIPERKPGA